MYVTIFFFFYKSLVIIAWFKNFMAFISSQKKKSQIPKQKIATITA